MIRRVPALDGRNAFLATGNNEIREGVLCKDFPGSLRLVGPGGVAFDVSRGAARDLARLLEHFADNENLEEFEP